jgi:hypothetical protein
MELLVLQTFTWRFCFLSLFFFLDTHCIVQYRYSCSQKVYIIKKVPPVRGGM